MLTRTRLTPSLTPSLNPSLTLALAPLLLTLLGVVAAPAHADVARPAVGQCRQLAMAQVDAASDPSAPGSCTAKHNVQTIAVVDVPDLATLTEEEFAIVGDAVCEAPLYRTIAGPLSTAKLTAYTLVFFEPTAAQLAAGESWVRCDLAINGGARLGQLPKHRLKAPVLRTRTIPAAAANCVKAAPPRSLDAGSYYRTTCAKKHDLRAVSTVKVAGKAKVRPGDRKFLKAARADCPKSWVWASWPSVGGWLAGDHLLVCYVAD